MDVTSQLNLEREAGMGENTERPRRSPQPARGCSRPGPGRGAGAGAAPREHEARLLQPATGADVVLASGPTKYAFFCFPQEITPPKDKPKTTEKPNSSPSVLEHSSVASQKEDSDNGTGFRFFLFDFSLQEVGGTTNNSAAFLKHGTLHISPVGRGKLCIRQGRAARRSTYLPVHSLCASASRTTVPGARALI